VKAARISIGNILKRGDIALAFGILTILVVLILPLPSIVLDLFLAISITLSILILMTALFIQAPLEFSAFPTILLISTMLRLSLNLASTRLILSRGTRAPRRRPRHRGVRQLRDGRQFRHRHHRVRDPGDRELRRHHQGLGPHRRSRGALPPRRHAGQADGDRRRPLRRPDRREGRASERRKALEDESGFFGAMDGASKFVRGDAIAGLLVVFINIIGGIIIGVAQQGMAFGEAARTYTLLTVGDGLVTQVPALIVSTAAGLLVSKAGVSGAADKALMKQLSGYPQALGMSAGVMLVLALLPGIPMLPFLRSAAAPRARLEWRKRTRASGGAEAAASAEAAGRRRAAPKSRSRRAEDRRSQDRARLRAAAAGQRRPTAPTA
jgi:flagellar biosynthesis protein FlhA